MSILLDNDDTSLALICLLCCTHWFICCRRLRKKDSEEVALVHALAAVLVRERRPGVGAAAGPTLVPIPARVPALLTADVDLVPIPMTDVAITRSAIAATIAIPTRTTITEGGATHSEGIRIAAVDGTITIIVATTTIGLTVTTIIIKVSKIDHSLSIKLYAIISSRIKSSIL